VAWRDRLTRLPDRTFVLGLGRRRREVLQLGFDPHAHLVHDLDGLRSGMRRFEWGLSEWLVHEHVGWVLRELGVTCVLDVGANAGQFGRELRRVGYRGRIVSFEPLPELVEQLRVTAAGDPDWFVVAAALGATDEQVLMHARPGTMSSLLPSSDFGRQWSQRLTDAAPVTVDVRRLDGLWDEAVAGLDDPRVYLKLDTQGYDLQAFAGAGERAQDLVGLQSEVSCVPIYEAMPRFDEQLRTYVDAGFALTGMFPVSFDAPTLRVIEYDAVLVRDGALPRDEGGSVTQDSRNRRVGEPRTATDH
jgi:FkbM family methyltransferase